MYTYEAELVMKSYMPKRLEKGMLFVKATPDETSLFELDHIPFDEEKWLVENGAPVELYIIDGDDVIAEPHEIGWFDESEDSDELREVTLNDINLILNEYDGWLEIQIVEETFEEEEMIVPIMYEQKVVINLITEEEEDEEDL